MKHYVKCTYRNGVMNEEKAVTINTPDDNLTSPVDTISKH